MKRKFITVLILLCATLSVSNVANAWDDPYDDLIGEPPFYFNAETLDELDDFLQSIDPELIAQDFVKYDQLSFMGSFEAFTCMDGEPFEIRCYSYTVRFHQFDTQKYGRVQVGVTHNTSWNYDDRFAALDISDADGDMAMLSESAAIDEASFGIIRREEMTFVYQGDALKFVEWEKNGMAFRLSYSIPWNEELPTGCLLERLLSLDDTAFNTAKAELLNIGSAELPATGDIVGLPIFLLCLSAAAVIILLRKKKSA